MKHIGWASLVISSVLLATLARSEERPRYGATLHVAMRATPSSLDPQELARSFGGRGLVSLIFDSLIATDENGHLQPALAESWQSSRGNQHWEVHLRQGVRFQDGTLLTSEIAAASLRVSNPSWKVSTDGNAIQIEVETADPHVPAELALPRNAIAKRDPQIAGTGPFTVAQRQAGKTITLTANEECWRGRPYLDSMEIETGKSFRDQMNAFDSRRADLVEVAPEQSHRTLKEAQILTGAYPIELLALVFRKDAASPEEKSLRRALGLSVERGSMRSVLLQGSGMPAGGLLPMSISGYGFVFSTDTDLQKARQLRGEMSSVPTWTLNYDASDTLLRVLAERIALNAKDAGLSLRPVVTGDSDLRLERIPIASGDAWLALSEVLNHAGVQAPKNMAGSVEDLYALEQQTLASERVIPLFHLPVGYASAPGLRGWQVRIDGSWDLSRAWLETSRP